MSTSVAAPDHGSDHCKHHIMYIVYNKYTVKKVYIHIYTCTMYTDDTCTLHNHDCLEKILQSLHVHVHVYMYNYHVKNMYMCTRPFEKKQQVVKQN